uniref:Interferon-induced protein 44-like n=1 Tax=Mola mola TaxID=94237 RepID=A0A3Q3X3X9_MOLML
PQNQERGSPNTYYPFFFNDIMGLEENTGVHVEDIKLALKGHVKEGYKFNPRSTLSDGDQFYEPNPTLEDRVHVLVCVLSANVSGGDVPVLQKMTAIREAASDLGIPQVAIITNVDTACGEIENDLQNVYKSKLVKKKVSFNVSATVGIPMNCIFPVKNYSEETAINDDVDVLILNTLRCIIDFGDDFLDKI